MRSDERLEIFRRAAQDFEKDPDAQGQMRACLALACGFMMGADMIQAAAAIDVAARSLWPGDPTWPRILPRELV